MGEEKVWAQMCIAIEEINCSNCHIRLYFLSPYPVYAYAII